jgi:hypothetical protein
MEKLLQKHIPGMDDVLLLVGKEEQDEPGNE